MRFFKKIHQNGIESEYRVEDLHFYPADFGTRHQIASNTSRL